MRIRALSFAIAAAHLVAAPGANLPLDTERSLAIAVDSAWERVVGAARAAGAIVQTMDSEAHLLGMTIVLPAEQVATSIVFEPGLPRSPQLAHIVVWLRAEGSGTRAFVRAAVGRGGLFLASNGAVERGLLDSIASGGAWRTSKSRPLAVEGTTAARPEITNALNATGCRVHAESNEEGFWTCALMIQSSEARRFAKGIEGLHPLIGVVTLWLQRESGQDRVLVRSILLESGAFAPPPLESNGLLERIVSEATRGKVAPIVSSIPLTNDFLQTLFDAPVAPNVRMPSSQEGLLGRPMEQVWNAVLTVTTQNIVVSQSDRRTGTLVLVAAHTTAKNGFSVHPMVIRLEDRRSGTFLSVGAPETKEGTLDATMEAAVLLGRITTQLKLKESLPWLRNF